jgi:hypothetical protein
MIIVRPLIEVLGKIMKLLLLLLLCNYSIVAQTTLLKYDYIETYTWSGVWYNLTPGGYYNNASVTPTLSAAIYGAGNGTSANEQNWYSMPNVTGLNASYKYEFRFRLASYFFSNSTATTKGVDVADIVDVQVSTNGGVSYVSELRVTGNNNSFWNYNTVGTITHTANGSFSASAAPTGDVYTSVSGNNTTLSTGYSIVTLKLPSNITQVAVDILARVNSAGEEWWIDNVELWQIKPVGLPVELVSFDGYSKDYKNSVVWVTASENGCDYYDIEKSIDGADWHHIGSLVGSGTTNEMREYSFDDYEFREIINYYRLIQYDFDGEYEVLGIIAIDNSDKKKYIIGIYDEIGRPIPLDFDGVKIILYSDGSSMTIF